MTDKIKMLLGIGAIALAGYLIWKEKQPKKQAFLGRRNFGRGNMQRMELSEKARFNRAELFNKPQMSVGNINDLTGCSKGGTLGGYNNGFAVYISNSGNGGWACKDGSKATLQQAGIR
jgi:hypothetical protein